MNGWEFAILGIVFFGSLQAVVYYFSYKGFEKGQVSILSPIFASFAGLVALLSVLIFRESINASFVPSLLLIFGGIILINLDLSSFKLILKFHLVPTPI